jgi:DNA primase
MPDTTSPLIATDDQELRDATLTAEQILCGTRHRVRALHYLRTRGIDTAAIPHTWRLGYAPPGWRNLTIQLSHQGFSDETSSRPASPGEAAAAA